MEGEIFRALEVTSNSQVWAPPPIVQHVAYLAIHCKFYAI
uniref:Uncharacterized protein n=1 Tax=Anguilla anguilla TaxID=7936 RepID=A0A0E9PPW9_ANGAN